MSHQQHEELGRGDRDLHFVSLVAARDSGGLGVGGSYALAASSAIGVWSWVGRGVKPRSIITTSAGYDEIMKLAKEAVLCTIEMIVSW